MAITPQTAQTVFNQKQESKVQEKLLRTMKEIIDGLLIERPTGITWTYDIRTPCNPATFSALADLYRKAGWRVTECIGQDQA